MDYTRHNKLLYIKEIISKHDDTSYIILNEIINNYNLEHSENSNGIFLNISVLNDEIIDTIYKNLININISSEIKPTFTIKPPKLCIKTKIEVIHDILSLEKFDKCLLQLSTKSISI
jgi:ABC-type enterochelin transport system ATPase subunit